MNFIILFLPSTILSQDYPYEAPPYPFIQYEKNKLNFYGKNESFLDLFKKMDTLFFEGEKQIHIVHIGGSHVQAGILSETMRYKFSQITYGSKGARGLIFPYRTARTTNPSNYYTFYKGNWKSCRNVERKRNCILGLSGISITTYDTSAQIKIYPSSIKTHFEFNRFKIFHQSDESSFELILKNDIALINQETDTTIGFTVFEMSHYTDTLIIGFQKKNPSQTQFVLYGILLESNDPGFVYHAAGINGAAVPSFLRCKLLTKHLQVISPDLIILGLGINDAYAPQWRFNAQVFEKNYQELLDNIRKATPRAAILFVTNNDSYYRRRYINQNGTSVENVMIKLAKKNGAGVWNLFEVMGGLGSIKYWEKWKLARRDKVHFSRPGYQLIADLLFQAILQAYENRQ